MSLSPPPIVRFRVSIRRRSRLARWSRLVPVACVLSALLGCSATSAPKAGRDLSAAGVTTANALAQFYDKLAADCVDTAELDTLLLGMNLDTLAASIQDPAERARTQQAMHAEALQTERQYESYAQAFRARAATARKLADLYTSLGNLSAYDASGKTGAAAANLSTTVAGLPGFQGRINFDPAPLTEMIAADLMSLKQAKDIHEASAITARVLEGVARLFDAESGGSARVPGPTTGPSSRPAGGDDLYGSIITRRSELAGEVAAKLIKRGYVDPSGVMKQLADSFGIPWNGQVKPDDKQTLGAAAQIQAFELRRQGALADAAETDISQALRALAQQHDRFARTGAFDPSQAQVFAQRAQAYIDEIESVRRQIKAAEEQRGKPKRGGPSTQESPSSG
jgi:hypothetical protein